MCAGSRGLTCLSRQPPRLEPALTSETVRGRAWRCATCGVVRFPTWIEPCFSLIHGCRVPRCPAARCLVLEFASFSAVLGTKEALTEDNLLTFSLVFLDRSHRAVPLQADPQVGHGMFHQGEVLFACLKSILTHELKL